MPIFLFLLWLGILQPAFHAAGWDDAPREAQDAEEGFRLPRGSLELIGEHSQALWDAVSRVLLKPRPQATLCVSTAGKILQPQRSMCAQVSIVAQQAKRKVIFG